MARANGLQSQLDKEKKKKMAAADSDDEDDEGVGLPEEFTFFFKRSLKLDDAEVEQLKEQLEGMKVAGVNAIPVDAILRQLTLKERDDGGSKNDKKQSRKDKKNTKKRTQQVEPQTAQQAAAPAAPSRPSTTTTTNLPPHASGSRSGSALSSRSGSFSPTRTVPFTAAEAGVPESVFSQEQQAARRGFDIAAFETRMHDRIKPIDLPAVLMGLGHPMKPTIEASLKEHGLLAGSYVYKEEFVSWYLYWFFSDHEDGIAATRRPHTARRVAANGGGGGGDDDDVAAGEVEADIVFDVDDHNYGGSSGSDGSESGGDGDDDRSCSCRRRRGKRRGRNSTSANTRGTAAIGDEGGAVENVRERESDVFVFFRGDVPSAACAAKSVSSTLSHPHGNGTLTPPDSARSWEKRSVFPASAATAVSTPSNAPSLTRPAPLLTCSRPNSGRQSSSATEANGCGCIDQTEQRKMKADTGGRDGDEQSASFSPPQRGLNFTFSEIDVLQGKLAVEQSNRATNGTTSTISGSSPSADVSNDGDDITKNWKPFHFNSNWDKGGPTKGRGPKAKGKGKQGKGSGSKNSASAARPAARGVGAIWDKSAAPPPSSSSSPFSATGSAGMPVGINIGTAAAESGGSGTSFYFSGIGGNMSGGALNGDGVNGDEDEDASMADDDDELSEGEINLTRTATATSATAAAAGVLGGVTSANGWNFSLGKAGAGRASSGSRKSRGTATINGVHHPPYFLRSTMKENLAAVDDYGDSDMPEPGDSGSSSDINDTSFTNGHTAAASFTAAEGTSIGGAGDHANGSGSGAAAATPSPGPYSAPFLGGGGRPLSQLRTGGGGGGGTDAAFAHDGRTFTFGNSFSDGGGESASPSVSSELPAVFAASSTSSMPAVGRSAFEEFAQKYPKFFRVNGSVLEYVAGDDGPADAPVRDSRTGSAGQHAGAQADRHADGGVHSGGVNGCGMDGGIGVADDRTSPLGLTDMARWASWSSGMSVGSGADGGMVGGAGGSAGGGGGAHLGVCALGTARAEIGGGSGRANDSSTTGSVFHVGISTGSGAGGGKTGKARAKLGRGLGSRGGTRRTGQQQQAAGGGVLSGNGGEDNEPVAGDLWSRMGAPDRLQVLFKRQDSEEGAAVAGGFSTAGAVGNAANVPAAGDGSDAVKALREELWRQKEEKELRKEREREAEAARQRLQAMLKQHKDTADSHYRHYRFKAAAAHYGHAIRLAEQGRAEDEDPCRQESCRQLALLHWTRAAAFMMLDMYSAATVDCLTAKNLDPSFLKVNSRLGRSYLRAGLIEKASSVFTDAIHQAKVRLADDECWEDKEEEEGGFGEDGDRMEKRELRGLEAECEAGRRDLREVNTYFAQARHSKHGADGSLKALKEIERILRISPNHAQATAFKADLMIAQRRYTECVVFSEQCALKKRLCDCGSLLDLEEPLPPNPLLADDAGSDDNSTSEHDGEDGSAALPLTPRKSPLRLAAPLLMTSELTQSYCSALRYSGRPQDADKVLEAWATRYQWAKELHAKYTEQQRKKKMADQAFSRGSYQYAVDLYTAALQADRQDEEMNAKLYCNRAAANMGLRSFKKAVSDCTEALRLKPAYDKARLRRARSHKALGDWAEAVTDYERLVKSAEATRVVRPISGVGNTREMKEELRECEEKQAEAEARKRSHRHSYYGGSANDGDAEEDKDDEDYLYSGFDSFKFYFGGTGRRASTGGSAGAGTDDSGSSRPGKGTSSESGGFYSSRRRSAGDGGTAGPRTMPGGRAQTQTRTAPHYTTLGLTSSASEADVKKAFRKLALKFHPDKNRDHGATDMFKSISEAYEVLSDETQRRMYDLQHRYR